jgi:hypothetical protein
MSTYDQREPCHIQVDDWIAQIRPFMGSSKWKIIAFQSNPDGFHRSTELMVNVKTTDAAKDAARCLIASLRNGTYQSKKKKNKDKPHQGSFSKLLIDSENSKSGAIVEG